MSWDEARRAAREARPKAVQTAAPILGLQAAPEVVYGTGFEVGFAAGYGFALAQAARGLASEIERRESSRKVGRS